MNHKNKMYETYQFLHSPKDLKVYFYCFILFLVGRGKGGGWVKLISHFLIFIINTFNANHHLKRCSHYNLKIQAPPLQIDSLEKGSMQ